MHTDAGERIARQQQVAHGLDAVAAAVGHVVAAPHPLLLEQSFVESGRSLLKRDHIGALLLDDSQQRGPSVLRVQEVVDGVLAQLGIGVHKHIV